jgi:hypothetical protein
VANNTTADKAETTASRERIDNSFGGGYGDTIAGAEAATAPKLMFGSST